ncbi:MAG TPA: hypothetical protein VIK72_06305 [Clostridiaceae bacterium]
MIKVRKLRPGAKIAIISPSSGLPYSFPLIYQEGYTDPKVILPLGCQVSFDLDKKEFYSLETPFINM